MKTWLQFCVTLATLLMGYLREKRIREQLDDEQFKRVDAAFRRWDDTDASSVSDDDPDLFREDPAVRDD